MKKQANQKSAIKNIAALIYTHRQLTWEMAKREVSDRYAGQVLGFWWAIAHPIFIMGLYVFVFAFVFKQKIGGTTELPLDYTTYLITGLTAWLSVQDTLIKSCSIITSNTALVKQTVFPIEVLVVKSVLVSLLPQLVSLIVLIAYVLITHGSIHATYMLLPFLVAIQIVGMLGIAFILAPIGAYFRDLKDIMQLFATAGVYVLPVFYLPAWVPALFKPVLYINPFSHLVWCYQDVLYFGRIEHPVSWAVNILFSFASFYAGYFVFRRIKPSLGNML